MIAVDEIVTNALEHGHPPPASRSWTTPDALFVQIDDRGSTGTTVTLRFPRPAALS